MKRPNIRWSLFGREWNDKEMPSGTLRLKENMKVTVEVDLETHR